MVDTRCPLTNCHILTSDIYFFCNVKSREILRPNGCGLEPDKEATSKWEIRVKERRIKQYFAADRRLSILITIDIDDCDNLKRIIR